jgi:phage/plasmid-associated DNA primase
VIYDPVTNSHHLFEDGLWLPASLKAMGEYVASFVWENCPDLPRKLATGRGFGAIAARLGGHKLIAKRDAFSNPPKGVILCKNGRVEIDRRGEVTFTPGDRGRRCDLKRTRNEINYNPAAESKIMMDWFNRIFCNRRDDVEAISFAMGAALYGSSPWKKLIYIYGEADRGKSQIPLLIERMAGMENCATFETARLGEQFEMRRFVGKCFLHSEELPADFMSRSCADNLKELTGFGTIRVATKFSSEEVRMMGDKMVMAASNYRPRIKSGTDRTAWESRLVYIVTDGPAYTTQEKNLDFIGDLFADEDEVSGILNFAIEGLGHILRCGWEQSPDQKARVQIVMDESTHVEAFVSSRIGAADSINENPDRPGVTASEAWAQYLDWTEEKGITPWPEQTAREEIKKAVEAIHRKPEVNNLNRNGLAQRGWRGLSLRTAWNPGKSEAA